MIASDVFRIKGRLEAATGADLDDSHFDAWRRLYIKDVGSLIAEVPVEGAPPPAPPAPVEPGDGQGLHVWTARDGVEELNQLLERVEARLEFFCSRDRQGPSVLETDQLDESQRHLRAALACFRRAAGGED